MKNKKVMQKILALALAGAMVFTTFSGAASGFVLAADETYISDSSLTDTETAAPTPDEVVPDANQYQYQKEELAAFCHFGPNTFNEVEWGENYGSREPSSIFTLSKKFDADKLVSTLKEAGFQKLIVTAKHHDGFCIWRSQYTTYDVESTNYDGDVLEEISKACTDHDMDMGLYLSPWDIHEPSYGYYDASHNPTTAENDVYDYNVYYDNQLQEILGNDKYGNNGHFTEVWMDGAKGSGANAQEYDFVKWFDTIQKNEGKASGKYDADCMLFGAQAYTTVRWIGNENGFANEETWAKSKTDKKKNTIDSNSKGSYTIGFKDGNQWTVPEADARITSGWFWGTTKNTPKSIGDLAGMYFNSVGHNSTFLLNVPPNNQGTIDDAIAARVKEFGDEIKKTFTDNFAAGKTVTATSVRGNDIDYKAGNVVDGKDDTYWTVDNGTKTGSLIVDLGESKKFDVVSIEEAIKFGQRITSFKVEYRDGTEGEWETFDEGTTIGAKRLSRKSPVKGSQIKITVTTNIAGDTVVPMISEVGVYKASKGFELKSVMPDDMDCSDIAGNDFTFTGTWTSETGAQYINNTNKWANANAEFTLNFEGSKVYLLGTRDPNHGDAEVYIDNQLVETIHTNAATRSVGQILFESDSLADAKHTLRLVVKTKAIGIEAAYAIRNEEMGMIGLEKAAYTMNEASTMEVKLVRTGGSKGKATVTLSPNPGTAIQDDFNTEKITTVTFEDGQTEATAEIETRRNENKTGDREFTIELSTKTEGLILGLNSVATVTIKDTESGSTTPSNPDRENYTEEDPFYFPETVDGDAAVLEAEHFILNNNTANDGNWPMQITPKDWASGGKFVNAMNVQDTITLYYYAKKAGTYGVTVTFRSGDSKNAFSWTEAEGNIEAGSVTAGADDAAGATHTVEFTWIVVNPGAGVLTLLAGDYNAPQLDKFDITLKEESGSITKTYTITAGVEGEGGTITPSGDISVEEGKEQVFTIAPDEGYEIEDVIVNGESVGKVTEYTFENVTADAVITASFKQKAVAPVVDKTKLKKQIEENADLTEDQYSVSSWKVYESALKNANEVLEDDTVTQETVDAALAALTAAAGNLKPTGVLPYTDVAGTDWFYDYVYDAYEANLMTGLSKTIFGPSNNLVRAQFAVILWRMEGSPKMKYTNQFPDVPEGQFFTDAVLWAQSEGIVTGYSNTGLFGSNDNITREQMAVMMYRYAKYKGYELDTSQDLSSFPDAGNVSAFAEEALKWCTGEGIITGDGGNLNPQGNTNRAVCATIIVRYSKLYK